MIPNRTARQRKIHTTKVPKACRSRDGNMISVLQAYLLFKSEVLGQDNMTPEEREQAQKRHKEVSCLVLFICGVECDGCSSGSGIESVCLNCSPMSVTAYMKISFWSVISNVFVKITMIIYPAERMTQLSLNIIKLLRISASSKIEKVSLKSVKPSEKSHEKMQVDCQWIYSTWSRFHIYVKPINDAKLWRQR